MYEEEEKKTTLKELITVHLCPMRLKQKWYLSFVPALIVLW